MGSACLAPGVEKLSEALLLVVVVSTLFLLENPKVLGVVAGGGPM